MNGFAAGRTGILTGYRAMKSDPDKFLNQLVVAALTVFIVVIMLLAALVLRQLWLQQHIANLSSGVQVSLDDLAETNEEIQRELGEIRTTTDEAQTIDNWEEITEVLDDVDKQLVSIEEDLSEVALALEPQADTPAALTETDEHLGATQDQVDQIFTIFVVLIGIASIAIALLLGLAVRVHQSASYRESR
jgi:ABC-type multidrug transport system fused ATPase/permease subunit